MIGFRDYTGVRKFLWLGCSTAILACGSLAWGAVTSHAWPQVDIQFDRPDGAHKPEQPKSRPCCGQRGAGIDLTVPAGPPAPMADGGLRFASSPLGSGGSGIAALLTDAPDEVAAHEPSDDDAGQPADAAEDLGGAATMSGDSASFGVRRMAHLPAMASHASYPGYPSPGPRAKYLRITGAPLDLEPLDPAKLAAVTGAVPEPATWTMLIGGLFGLGGLLRAGRRPTLPA